MRPLHSLAAALIVMAAPASAGEIRNFNRAAFQNLQARNAPSIVFVHASWCPICRAQETTIDKLLSTPAYRNVTVFRIDYDTQKPLWTSFGVQKQSTLIAFHGRRETARLSYDANPQKVTALVTSALH
jgi:thioredoxin-like negative regulator of GroEL